MRLMSYHDCSRRRFEEQLGGKACMSRAAVYSFSLHLVNDGFVYDLWETHQNLETSLDSLSSSHPSTTSSPERCPSIKQHVLRRMCRV